MRVVIALLTLLATPALAQQLSIELSPRMDGDKVSHIDVRETLTAPNLAAGAELAKMPIINAMMPGALLDGKMLEAADASGALPLTIKDDPVDPSNFKQDRVWLTARATKGDVTIRFKATPRVITPETKPGPLLDMRTDGQGVYGSFGNTLALPTAGWPRPLRIIWDLSDMPAGSRGATSLGEGTVSGTYARGAVASTYYMAGPLQSSPKDGSGAFVAYWLTPPSFDLAGAMAWTKQGYDYFGKFWSETDLPFRVFMRTTDRFQGGGTGGYQSFIFGAVAGEDRNVRELRGLLAHEMNHNWIGGLGSGNQWYSEGANSYYTSLLTHRAGLMTAAEFGEDMNNFAKLYYLNPRSNLSNAEVTRLFFTDGDAQVVPYQRGPLYFAMVDARIRKASGGKKTLDAMIKPLVAVRRTTELTPDHWIRQLKLHLGDAGVAEYEAMMAGKPLDLPSEMLGPCFKAEPFTYTRTRLGFRLIKGPEGSRVNRLEPSSPAGQAGLQDNDIVLNPEIIYGADERPAAPLSVKANRNGQTITANFTPVAIAKPGLKWVRTDVPENACNI